MKKQTYSNDIVQLYYYIKFRGIADFHTIAFISVTSVLSDSVLNGSI